MERKVIEVWVGLFVVVGIVVVCGLVLQFGKFKERFHPTYTFGVRFQNVGQIPRGAPVITAGVSIGKVEQITLEREGTVRLTLAIWKGIEIHKDAHFTIKQAGLLGDLHVVVVPQADKAPMIEPGDIVNGVTPTDIQDTLEQAAAIVGKMKNAADNVENATRKLDKDVMNEQTLADLRQAISNINVASGRADHLIEEVRGLVGKTTTGIDATMANLNQFSTNLSLASAKTLDILKNNEEDVRTAVQNVKTSSEHLNAILADVESGKGNAGWLLKDESFHRELNRLITNLRRFGVLHYKDVPLTGAESKPDTRPGAGAEVPSARSKP